MEVPGADGHFGLAGRDALLGRGGRSSRRVAVGPGLGRADDAQALVRELIAVRTAAAARRRRPVRPGRPAGAAGRPAAAHGAHAPRGRAGPPARPSADEVAAQRLECARAAAQRSGATVLLKGEATIVADPRGTAYVVPTGNPGLATPGTGDVLSGVIVGQLAKGLPATEAACLGAYVHGLAADLAARESVGTEGMIASDLFQTLPAAVERLKAGARGGDAWPPTLRPARARPWPATSWRATVVIVPPDMTRQGARAAVPRQACGRRARGGGRQAGGHRHRGRPHGHGRRHPLPALLRAVRQPHLPGQPEEVQGAAREGGRGHGAGRS